MFEYVLRRCGDNLSIHNLFVIFKLYTYIQSYIRIKYITFYIRLKYIPTCLLCLQDQSSIKLRLGLYINIMLNSLESACHRFSRFKVPNSSSKIVENRQ